MIATVCPVMPKPDEAARLKSFGFGDTISEDTSTNSAKVPRPAKMSRNESEAHTSAPGANSSGAEGPASSTHPAKSKPGIGFRRNGSQVGRMLQRKISA